MAFDPLKLEVQLCFRLYAASRNMTRIYQPILARHGITYPQYIVLLILFEHETIDFKELSQMIDLKTGTLTPIIQKLQELGFLDKEKNPLDGRRINVNLTAKGKALKGELSHIPFDLAERIGLEEENYMRLTSELDHLLDKLTNAQETTE